MAGEVYNTGTVAVANGATAVTGVGTTWLTSGIRAGDQFWANGLSVRIASVNSNTSITLASGWPGTTLSAGSAYEIRYIFDGERLLAATNALINTLSSGNNAALAGLTTAADKLSYWTGAGVAALVDFKAWARGFIGAVDAAAGRTALGVSATAETVLLATNQTITGLKEIILNTATTTTDCLRFKPTDFGTGKPYFTINKSAVASQWNLSLWDGTNANGTINIGASTFTWNGASLATLSTAQTFSATKSFAVGTATTFAAYMLFQPTDYGTGKYRLSIDKMATANLWQLGTYDGVDGNGVLQIVSGAGIKLTGAYNVTTANAANVNVASDGTLARSTSSEKYKTDIEPMADEYADMILEMEPIWYRSTCAADNPEHSFWGLSAESVAAIDPRLVHWRTHSMVTTVIDRLIEEEIDGEIVERVEQVPVTEAVPLATPEPEGVAYERVTVHLISVVQRIWTRLNGLVSWQSAKDAEVAVMQDQIEALTARLDALEA